MASNDFDGTVTSDGDSGVSRRDAIKKGAVVGGAVLWATPVIQAIGISPASATHVSPNVPHCPCLTCAANAVGLSVANITVGGTADGTGGPACSCVVQAVVDVNTVVVGDADAEVICARADDATCTASAYVAGLEIKLATTGGGLLPLVETFLRVSALGSCVNCGTGASYIADVRLVVETNGIVTSSTTVILTAVAGCTTGASVLGGLVTIRANEQTCNNGVLTVNALRVTALGINVIAGQSQAGAQGCACTPCSTAATCTPPRSRLC